MFKNLFGFGGSEPVAPPDGIFANLANNIHAIIKDIEPVLDDLGDKRVYLLQDFSVIMVRASGSKIKDYHKIAFSLLTYLIVQRDESIVATVNKFSEELSLKTLLPVFESQKKLFTNLTSGEYEYMLLSFAELRSKYHDMLKKALYEFAEVVIKADGTVTPEEIKNLQELNRTYLNIDSTGNSQNKSPDDKVTSGTGTAKQENKEEGKEKDEVKKEAATVKNDIPSPEDIDAILAELNELVGLDNIKEDIKSLINILKSNKARKEQGLPELKISLHAVFTGPPGTGKTTIARILSKIYGSLQVLPGNNFIETDRSGLVGGFVGQTAIKTDKLVNDALNGILFIDEAYSLSRGTDNDYGHEAIETILKRMEDHRDKLVVIVAGYENEMKEFIASNPGLQSRFSRYFTFADYTPEQLTSIYGLMSAKSGFRLTSAAQSRVLELFALLYNNRDSNFGNARLARNIFEKSFEKHANRTAPIVPVTRELLTTMEEADIPFDEFWQV